MSAAFSRGRAALEPRETKDTGEQERRRIEESRFGPEGCPPQDQGACADGEDCDAGTCVAASVCPPSGPFGTSVGDVLDDWSLEDCDGVTHSFHDLCELRAVHIFSFAGW